VGSNQQKKKKLEQWVLNHKSLGLLVHSGKKNSMLFKQFFSSLFARHNKRVKVDRLVTRGDTFFFWDAFFLGGVFGRFHTNQTPFGSDFILVDPFGWGFLWLKLEPLAPRTRIPSRCSSVV